MAELEDIETFTVVADVGGVSPAARRLGVSKSIVSRRLLRLETELGIQLLARTTRGAGLTEAGMTFREHANADRSRDGRQCERSSPQPESCAAACGSRHRSPSDNPTWRPCSRRWRGGIRVFRYMRRYGDRFVDLVSEGFDAAIRVGYLSDSNLIARRIGPVPGKVVASPSYVAQHGRRRRRRISSAIKPSCKGRRLGASFDGDKTISVRPQGRFKADNGTPFS